MTDDRAQGTLSVNTTRLLKSVLPAACLWTGLREEEGLSFDNTVSALKVLYPPEHDEEECMQGESILPCSVPEPIREMANSSSAMIALGSLIW